jgi:putative PIN family toxin of toxin-antitoxin system
MVDANIIISAGLFPESNVGRVLAHVVKNHKLVICQYTLNELKNVFRNKFPERIEYLNSFVRKLKYELVDVETIDYENYPKIRDNDDMPLLACAIKTKVNILITGDKDFDEIMIEALKIMKPREYIEEYIK